ncbi:hypothetical protein F1C76_21415 [Geodermatophilaceae bacterium NBWT11]|nr:hypothetical protein F1C76_21415 [Geodermatophilaceae bacterium NBWT11]
MPTDRDDIPAQQPPVGATVPVDAQLAAGEGQWAASPADAPGPAAGRRDRLRRALTRRPTTRRGRGLLAALAAVALLFVGGGAGFAVGHEAGGGDGRGTAQVDDRGGDRGGPGDGDHGVRGDRDQDGDQDGDGSTSSSTTSPSTTSPTTSSPATSAPATASPTT